jgi:hypothetical protein
MQSEERLAQKVNYQRVIQQGGTVIAWDFNVHGILWDPGSRVLRNAAFWEEVVNDNGLDVGNDGLPKHYRRREVHEGGSVVNEGVREG